MWQPLVSALRAERHLGVCRSQCNVKAITSCLPRSQRSCTALKLLREHCKACGFLHLCELLLAGDRPSSTIADRAREPESQDKEPGHPGWRLCSLRGCLREFEGFLCAQCKRNATLAFLPRCGEVCDKGGPGRRPSTAHLGRRVAFPVPLHATAGPAESITSPLPLRSSRPNPHGDKRGVENCLPIPFLWAFSPCKPSWSLPNIRCSCHRTSNPYGLGLTGVQVQNEGTSRKNPVVCGESPFEPRLLEGTNGSVQGMIQNDG